MQINELLTRDEFRKQCLERDGYKCVFCKSNVDIVVHHAVERRLFSNGGYYKNNGISVCSDCHVKCETTEISLEEALAAAGIQKRVLPEHLYDDPAIIYDKWTNIILEDGGRLRGELFFDESVQKILARGNKLGLFTKYVKYPRTCYLSWTEKIGKDDRYMESEDAFKGQRVIVTEKLDGQNYTFYNDYCHARSLDSKRHVSQDWVKQFHAQICGDIPEGWRVCGENLYMSHTLLYTDLPTYFLGFSVWNEYNECLGWDETLEWFELLGITPVNILYDGIYGEQLIKSLWNPEYLGKKEGYVVRVADRFSAKDFRHKVGKFVAKGFDNTHAFFRGINAKNELAK